MKLLLFARRHLALALLAGLLAPAAACAHGEPVWSALDQKHCGDPPRPREVEGRWLEAESCFLTPRVKARCDALPATDRPRIHKEKRCGGPPPDGCEDSEERYLIAIKRRPCVCTTEAERTDCSNRP